MEGWIKLHRQSMDHWLYKTKKPKSRREAWEDMLLLVNYEEKKTLIRGQVYECGIGQSLLSLESWAKQFNWSKQMVRTFFALLEKDKMLTLEGLQYTTRLTICNYAQYQQQATHEQHTKQHTANTRLTPTKESKEEEYRYNSFYDDQLAKCNGDVNYPLFVKWLFETNINKRPLTNVLKMKDQITYERFNKYMDDYGPEKLKTKILSIDNSTKKYLSFNTTLNNWLKGD
jgi:hypothetical protein